MSSNKSRLAVVVMIISGATGAVAGSDALTELGVSGPDARQETVRAIESGEVNYEIAAAAFKAAPGTVRARLVQRAVAWARAYTSTAEFTTDYASMRTAHAPVPPAFDGTPEDEFQRQVDDQLKAAELTKAASDSLSPERRAQADAEMQQALAAIRQLNAPDMRTRLTVGIRVERDQRVAKYEQAVRTWDAKFPEDSSRLIARRLRTFLEISAEIDYDARVEPRNGLMVFVDDAYERKPREWKLCYRVGREAVEAARDAAAAWLKELK